MSEQVQVAVITYGVPALAFIFMELRRRRMTATLKREQIAAGKQVSDAELGKQFRDEIWERWRLVNEENTELRERVSALEGRAEVAERRMGLLVEIIVRRGFHSDLPEWAKASGE